jgi:hypothetical protein
MKTSKKILLIVIGIIVTAGYIFATSLLVNSLFKPVSSSEDLTFDTFGVRNADGQEDPEDSENTLFVNIDKSLRYNDDSAISKLKMVTLYEVYVREGMTADPAGETIELEVSGDIAEDEAIEIIRIMPDKSITIIASSAEKRIRLREGAEEEYYVLVFDAPEEGYYAIVSERSEAKLAWLLALLTIGVVVVLFIVGFVFLKPNRLKEKI